MVYHTDEKLSDIVFNSEDICKIISGLDPNKAREHDMISIRILKICGESIHKPLESIFRASLNDGRFPSEWKKANVVPIHKKDDKQILKNYRPVSLLPICAKIFERIIYNRIFEYLIENNLITENQPGFKPGDSFINQLLSITHDIYKSLDGAFEVKGVFLDISKAFDKVWHEGLIFKLKQNGISGKLLNIIKDFLDSRKQRAVLNGQYSSWASITAGVHQGSILEPLFFLIYINDLSNNLSSNSKLFADDTSLFSVVHKINTSTNNLNKDLKNVNDWAAQWEMSFNPDPTKQAQEVIFSRKIEKPLHIPLNFNNTNVKQTVFQNHLGLILDSQLSFEEHLKTIFSKANKTIGLIRKLRNSLPRPSLMTLYKSFIQPHLDYGDIIYDQPFNNSFQNNIESIQYNACFVITGAIRGTSKERLYEELGLESLQHRRWYRRICYLYKIVVNESPNYLFKIVITSNTIYKTRNTNDIPLMNVKHNFFNNTFFPSTIIEWNKLDPEICTSASFDSFKESILKFIRPAPNSICQCHNPKGIKYLTRLRVNFSHFRDHKFKHSFQDTINPFCTSSLEAETTIHFILHCPSYENERNILLSSIRSIKSSILDQNDDNIVKTLLYGLDSLSETQNTSILNATMEFLISSNRFEEQLY